jgi:hypothetical protein
MKTKIVILILALSAGFVTAQAKRKVVTTTRAASYDISDNLDLDAVASIFGDAENLEDFERRLNDPDNRISNLDLNEDGYIDYLRVLENSSNENSLVVIQAVLDKDVFQDVATIEIERDSNNRHRIQIVGDSYIYGSNYIIEPVFVHAPLIFSFFWSPRYISWHSPYYWNYYPHYYHSYRPYSPFKYRRHVYSCINFENSYHRANDRHIHFSGESYNHIRRNDYAARYPNRAFVSRHEGIKNRNDLNERRGDNHSARRENVVSNKRKYKNNWNSNSEKNDRMREGNVNRRPDSNEKSGQVQPREYKRETNRNRLENNRQIEKKDTERREKSGSVNERSRSNREVKQNKPVESRTESPKKESEKSRRR